MRNRLLDIRITGGGHPYNKKLLFLMVLLSTCIILSGCNSKSEENVNEPVADINESIDDGIDDLPPGDVSSISRSPSEEAVERFLEFAWEMEFSNQTSTRERMIEVFGTPREENEYMLDFAVTYDVEILGLISADGLINNITIYPLPDFFIDDNLKPDYEKLKYYVDNQDGLTLEYFEALFDKPGKITSYGYGLFTYVWGSTAFEFMIDADRDNIVKSVFFIDKFQLDEDFDQSFFVVPEEVKMKMYNLAWEIERSAGQITPARAKEIVGMEYTENENIITFPFAENAVIFVIVEDNGMVEEAHLTFFVNVYLNESIPIGADELVVYKNNTEGKTLEYFEELLSSPGTLTYYRFNEFLYSWIFPEFSVQISVDQNGVIIEFVVYDFDTDLDFGFGFEAVG